MIFAVDFDGTIVEQAWPGIGKERKHAISVMKVLQKAGHRIIIFTVRNGGCLVDMWNWMKIRKFIPDAVNGNLFFIEGASVPKIYADVYLDDRSFPPFTNWSHVFNVFIMNNPITEYISENEHFCKSYFTGVVGECNSLFGSARCTGCDKRTMTIGDYEKTRQKQ